MSKSNGGKITMQGIELNGICDVCQRDRAHGNHKRCSRIRQEKYRVLRKTESIQQEGK